MPRRSAPWASVSDPDDSDETKSDQAPFDDAYDEQLRAIGRVNVAVFGLTGVGKSSLVNAIFGIDVAATGIGDPVTRGVNRYINEAGTLAVWDCEGFEVDSKKPIKWLQAQVAANREADAEDLFHVAWYAVSAHARRLEPGQVRLIEALHELKIPVVLVMTQVPVRDGEVSPDAAEFARVLAEKKLPVVGGRPVLTAAVADPFANTAVHGLQELLDATDSVVPEGRRQALAAAQRVDLTRKTRYARALIASAASFAGGVGFVPVPFADAAVLVPTQAALMAKIAAIYGIPKKEAAELAGVTTTLAAAGGKLAAASLIGLIPGVGQVINAGVASTITATIGESWRAVCERVFTGKIDLAQVEDVKMLADVFKAGLKRKVGLDGTPNN